MTALRELAAELAAELADVGMCDDDYQLGRAEAGQEIAKRIIQILDAEGDAGAVFSEPEIHAIVIAAVVAENMAEAAETPEDRYGGLMHAEHAELLREIAKRIQTTHPQPVWSGVVSDEQSIESIAHRWAIASYAKALDRPFEDIDSIRRELRAALTHFAKSQGDAG